MKKNVLVVALALYTATGFSGRFDDPEKSLKYFATGFGIGLAHGSLNRAIGVVPEERYNCVRVTPRRAFALKAPWLEQAGFDVEGLPKLFGCKDEREAFIKSFSDLQEAFDIQPLSDEDFRLICKDQPKPFFAFVTLAGAIKVHETVAHRIGNKDVTFEQLAGHALGQMVAEGFEINSFTFEPRIVLSLNTTMVLAVIKFLQGPDSEK